MLKIHNLSFAIDGKPLFDNASAVIPTGHKVGIVGRNGVWKDHSISADPQRMGR